MKELKDIQGKVIKEGNFVADEDGFKYQFKWDKVNNEWIAESLSIKPIKYPMYQERVSRNSFRIIA